MIVDYLIIGQGIAGTLLSYELLKAGKTVIVIDEPQTRINASLAAAAVLNPAAGKNWSLSADHGKFIPCALKTYQDIGVLLNRVLCTTSSLIIFHETEDDRKSFEGKHGTQQTIEDVTQQFNAPHGLGCINPVYRIDANNLLQCWRQYLVQQNSFQETVFNWDDCEVRPDCIVYKDIIAGRIICCEGASARSNRLFERLPFTQNRGDALLLAIPGLVMDYICHRQVRLVPRADGLFWCGSNYNWNYRDMSPDVHWRRQTVAQLEQWLKLPLEVHSHIVAERPTTAGQFPLLGFHPQYRSVGIFNGLGTRGFSSGPYWAASFANYLSGASKVIAGYDTERFIRYFRQ